MLPVAPPSPDYPHDPNFVPEPIYPEYIPLEDKHILPVEERPLPPVVLPTTESPEYVAESDPEEDPEEYEDDETKDGPVDYPMDGGDDGDDDNRDSSGDDADDEDEDEEGGEEEEHLAPADSAVVIPTDELVSLPGETETVIPPPSTDTATTRARITVRLILSTRGRAVMSSASSAVTYSSVYTDSEPGRVFWGADEELSDGGSPRVIVYGHDGLPMLPVAPPSPDYPHDPDFVPEPIYPKYIPLEDKHVLPVEERPLPPVVSPTTESPEYVAESDLEEDPEEYGDDETEDGPVDYPIDGGDDGDDDNRDSSRDDADDEDEDEEGEEEEEHLAPADSAVVIPTDELVSLPGETETVIPPPSTDTATTRARITVLPHYHHPLQGSVWLDARPQLHYHHHHYHHLYTCHHLLNVGMISPRLRCHLARAIMSHTSSVVTYTSVYTDSEPGRVFWGADEELSDGGPSRVIVYGYNGLPMLPVAPPSPDYIPGPKEPQTPPAPQDEDEHEPMFIQPMILISCQSLYTLRYVAESNPEEDPEEYEDDETEDGLVDYPMDGGDDGDDDDGDSSGDDTSTSLPPATEVERLLAMTTLLPSPLTSLSPPSAGERLARVTAPSEHSSPPPIPPSGCLTQTRTLRTAFTQALVDAVTAALPSPLLPPSLYPPPPVDRRDDIPDSEQPPRKRVCLSTLGSRHEVGESSTRGRGIDYRDTWIDPTEAVPEMEPTTFEEVNTRVTELAELHEHDTQDLYALLEDAQDGRIRISQRVSMDSQRVDLLMADRMTLQETVWIMEEEAYSAREAWAHLIGLSQTVHHELQTLREQVHAQEYQLQAHQAQLQLQSTLIQTQHQLHETHSQIQKTEMAGLQEANRAELLALRGQLRRAGQLGGDARVPNHQDAPRDADSHI
nr:hypothetical protein [Tanacetum cinerariifolium]